MEPKCQTCGSYDVDDYGCMTCFSLAAVGQMFSQLDKEENDKA
jgi:hypothetical protein